VSALNWRAPVRDAAYVELEAACRSRGFLLRSARSYGEALKRDGDYWLIASGTESQIFEADSLADVRAWLRIPSKEAA
jgi:hypothetical protein